MPELPHVAHGAWVRKRPKPRANPKKTYRRPITVSFVSPVQDQIRKWQSLGSGNVVVPRTKILRERPTNREGKIGSLTDESESDPDLPPKQRLSSPETPRDVQRTRLPGQSQPWKIWGNLDPGLEDSRAANEAGLKVSGRRFSDTDRDSSSSFSGDTDSSNGEAECVPHHTNEKPKPIVAIGDDGSRKRRWRGLASLDARKNAMDSTNLQPKAPTRQDHDGTEPLTSVSPGSEVLLPSNKPTIEGWLSRTNDANQTTNAPVRMRSNDRELRPQSPVRTTSELSTSYAATQRPRSVVHFPTAFDNSAPLESISVTPREFSSPEALDDLEAPSNYKDFSVKRRVPQRPIHENNRFAASVLKDDAMKAKLETYLKDELEYRGHLRLLINSVIPRLISEYLSKSKCTGVESLGTPLPARSPTDSIRQLLNTSASIEKLNSIHQQIPMEDVSEFIRWALLAAKAYTDYVDHWFFYRGTLETSGHRRNSSLIYSDGAFGDSDSVDGSVNGNMDVNDLLQRPLKRLQAMKKLLKEAHVVFRSYQSEQACMLFTDLTRKAKERVNEEESQYEDSLAMALDLIHVRDPRTLLPFSNAVIDAGLHVFAKDEFAFYMSHSSGKLIDCHTEIIMRTLGGDNLSDGDLLIVVRDGDQRPWMLFPPLPLRRISYEFCNETALTLAIKGSSLGDIAWQERFNLISDVSRIRDWLKIMDENPFISIAAGSRHAIAPIELYGLDDLTSTNSRPILSQEARSASCDIQFGDNHQQHLVGDVCFTLLHWQQSDGWVPLVEEPCMILIKPRLLEFVLSRYALAGGIGRFTPKVLTVDSAAILSIRRTTALDISIIPAVSRLADINLPRKPGNLLLRARSVSDCGSLLALLRVTQSTHGRDNGPIDSVRDPFSNEQTQGSQSRLGWFRRFTRAARSTDRSIPTDTSDQSRGGLTAASRVLNMFRARSDRSQDKTSAPSANLSGEDHQPSEDQARGDWLAIIEQLHPLGPTNLDVRLFTKQNGQNWEYFASGRLIILRTDDRISHLDNFPCKRVILFSKQKNDVLFDCRVRQDGFEMTGRTGIVAKIWEPLQGSTIPGDGGVIGGSLTQFMIQLRSEAEASYTFSVLTAGAK